MPRLALAGGRGRVGNSRGLGARTGAAARTRACQVGGVGSRVTAEVVAVGRLAPKERRWGERGEEEAGREKEGGGERRQPLGSFGSACSRVARRGVGDGGAAGWGPRAGRGGGQ